MYEDERAPGTAASEDAAGAPAPGKPDARPNIKPDGIGQYTWKIQPGRHRLTKKYVPLGIVSSFRQGIWIIIAIVLSSFRITGELDFKLPLGLVIGGSIALWLIIATISYYISYIRFTWEITDDELHIYKGLISRKQLHVPYVRIHSANIEASLFDRMFGVVTLKMDTAGGGNKGSDAQIPALERRVAEEIRDEVFMRKRMAEGGQTVDFDAIASVSDSLKRESDLFSSDVGVYLDGKGPDLGHVVSTQGGARYRLSAGELILTGLSSGSTLLIIVVVFSAVGQLMAMLGETSDVVVNLVGEFMNSLMAKGALALTLFIVGILLVAMFFSVLGKVVVLWNFTVQRGESKIEVGRGLLSKKNASISVPRIQAVRIKQGILRRMIGYAEISVERVMATMETNNKNNSRLVENQIHPFIKLKKVDEFLAAMLPEFADAPQKENLVRLGGAALRRSFFRYARRSLIYFILPLAAVWVVIELVNLDHTWPGAVLLQSLIVGIGLVVFLYVMVTAFFVYRGRAVGYDSKMLVMKEGAYGRRFVYMPRRKIQYAVKAQNPFQRWSGVATITARSAAPTMRNVSTIDVSTEFADNWLEWVESYTPIN